MLENSKSVYKMFNFAGGHPFRLQRMGIASSHAGNHLLAAWPCDLGAMQWRCLFFVQVFIQQFWHWRCGHGACLRFWRFPPSICYSCICMCVCVCVCVFGRGFACTSYLNIPLMLNGMQSSDIFAQECASISVRIWACMCARVCVIAYYAARVCLCCDMINIECKCILSFLCPFPHLHINLNHA